MDDLLVFEYCKLCKKEFDFQYTLFIQCGKCKTMMCESCHSLHQCRYMKCDICRNDFEPEQLTPCIECYNLCCLDCLNEDGICFDSLIFNHIY